MYNLLKSLLFLLSPELAHEFALKSLSILLRLPIIGSWIRKSFQPINAQPIVVKGVTFPNTIGLAAGFDKNAKWLPLLKDLGFGHVEIGTVTPLPQPGNPAPRLFRLPQDNALINRMGFNNDGAAITARRIAEARGGNGAGIPVAVNIGKSKVAPLDEAAADHLVSYRLLRGVADFVVVNVSSPNTPGLRELQDRDHLTAILGALRDEDASMRARDGRVPMPFLVKLAPDLPDAQIEDAVDLAGELGLAGVVLTNTTIAREGLLKNPADPAAGEQGGLSGPPVRARAALVAGDGSASTPPPMRCSRAFGSSSGFSTPAAKPKSSRRRNGTAARQPRIASPRAAHSGPALSSRLTSSSARRTRSRSESARRPHWAAAAPRRASAASRRS